MKFILILKFKKILSVREKYFKIMPVSRAEITSGKYAFHPEVARSSFVAPLVALCPSLSQPLFSRDSRSVKHLAITV